VACRATRGPDKNDASATQVTRSDEAKFSIISAIVFNRYDLAGKHLASICEIQPALVQCSGSFCRVKGDVQ
jgi:hypothetical protein